MNICDVCLQCIITNIKSRQTEASVLQLARKTCDVSQPCRSYTMRNFLNCTLNSVLKNVTEQSWIKTCCFT